jgi:LacI family transcriptional regulator
MFAHAEATRMAASFDRPSKRREAFRRVERMIREQSLWGQQLLGELELAERVKVGRTTLRAALADMEAQGLIERRKGAGTFVKDRPVKDSPRRRHPAQLAIVVEHHHDMAKGWLYGAEMIRGALSLAGRQGVECSTLSLDVPEEEARIRDTRALRSYDGFICVSVDDREIVARLVELRRGPVVLLDHSFRDLPITSVVDGSFAGSRALTRHLLALGHRRIAFFNCHRPAETNPEKLAGFRAAIKEKGLSLDPDLIAEAPPPTQPETLAPFAEALVERWLALPEPPTAILGFDDHLAMNVLVPLERRGLRIGSDVSVAGQGDAAFRRGLSDWLTSTRVYPREMGREAARLALAGQPPSEGRTVIVPNRLYIRKSTQAPKGAGQ